MVSGYAAVVYHADLEGTGLDFVYRIYCCRLGLRFKEEQGGPVVVFFSALSSSVELDSYIKRKEELSDK